MLSPINMFDMGTIQGGMQAGMQRGAVNSPFTPLGQALSKTLDIYTSSMQQQRQAAADMQVQESRNANALDVQRLQNEGAMSAATAKQEAMPEVPGMADYDITNPTEVAVGGVPHFVQPIYSKGRIVGKKLQSARPLSLMEMMGKSDEAPVESETDREVRDLMEALKQAGSGELD